MIPRLVATLCAAALIVSCAPSQPETMPSDVQVVVEMRDYSIKVDPASVSAGTVKFGIKNAGAMPHQFDLIRTDLAPDKLPIDTANAKAKEDGLLKQVLNIQAGRIATATAELQPGHYVIICNIAGHYQLGMRGELTVR